jgi:hypothetical protein
MPKSKYAKVPRSRARAYKALKKIVSESYARHIAVDGVTFKGRSRMAKKAARTRRRNRR